MNLAQAVHLIQRGEFEWRDLGMGRSVLAFELGRYHAACDRPAPAGRYLVREEVVDIAERAVALLKETRERLDVMQLCQRLQVAASKARTLRRILDKLSAAGELKSFGHYRRTYGAPKVTN